MSSIYNTCVGNSTIYCSCFNVLPQKRQVLFQKPIPEKKRVTYFVSQN